MSTPPRIQSAAQVCATIAHHILHPTTHTPTILGEIHLHPHQVIARDRIHATCTSFGGALLCDDVGLGKTYIALAVAAAYNQIHIVAPAVLRPMWQDALQRAGLVAEVTSFESLSMRAPSRRATAHDIVIVDEAHHARTPTTARYPALATLCGSANVLLLSATPIHNHRTDLTALLALIVGDRASTLTDEELSQLIIRRTQQTTKLDATIPTIHTVEWLRPSLSDEIIDTIVNLPPALPAVNTTLPHHLLTHTLVRQYVSSTNALRTALRRRLSRADTLLTTLRSGHYPTTHELRLWTHTDDSTQLAFPSFTTELSTKHDATTLITVVQTHAHALETLLAQLPSSSPNDIERADWIRQIRTRHPTHRIVAFSQYAATIHALFRVLRIDPHIASITSRSAHIVTGPVSREEVLSRFTHPESHDHKHRPHEHTSNSPRHPLNPNAITLLLTTDLLSEGVNLQHASVIVHLDLPWTAAKLTQRVGRVARIGSAHHNVFVYGVLPSRKAEEILKATTILRRKSRVAAAALGPSKRVRAQAVTSPSIPECTERIHARLRTWLQNTSSHSHQNEDPAEHPPVAIIPSQTHALLAACRIGTRTILLSGYTSSSLLNPHTYPTLQPYALTTDPKSTWTLLRSIDTHTITMSPASSTQRHHTVIAHARQSITNWFTTIQASSDAGVSHAIAQSRVARHKRAWLKQASALTALPSLTHRARTAPFLARAYQSLATPLSPTFTKPPTKQSFETFLADLLPEAERASRPATPTPTTFTLLALLLLLPPSH